MSLKIVHSGIIPYYYNTLDKQYYLFLSEEGRYPKKWCGFAGGRDDGEDITTSAAREAWEESMGLLGNRHTLLNKIINADYVIFSHNGNNASVQYLIKCDREQFISLEDNFNNVCQYIRNCNGQCLGKIGCYEKSRGKWFKLPQIIKAAVQGSSIGHNLGNLRELFDMSLTTGKIIKKPTKDMFNKYF